MTINAIRALFLSALFVSTGATAQSAVRGWAEAPTYWTLGTHLGHMWIDNTAATREGLGDSATVVSFNGNLHGEYWLLTLGGEVHVLRDREGFSELVEDDWGHVRRRESEASAAGVHIAIGPQYALPDPTGVSLYAQVGMAHSLFGERSIEYCEDCYSEDLDLELGPFARFGLQRKGDRFHYGAFLQTYLNSDDVERTLAITFNFVL